MRPIYFHQDLPFWLTCLGRPRGTRPTNRPDRISSRQHARPSWVRVYCKGTVFSEQSVGKDCTHTGGPYHSADLVPAREVMLSIAGDRADGAIYKPTSAATCSGVSSRCFAQWRRGAAQSYHREKARRNRTLQILSAERRR